MSKKKPSPASAAPKVELVSLSSLKPASYNPRSVTPGQLEAICRSVREFGVVDPLIARREDRLLIGGHQRYKALAKLAEAGEYDAEHVPVVFVDGLDDRRAKLLNLALNRVSGDWEHEALARLIGELTEGVGFDAIAVSGFERSEVDDYLALLKDSDQLGREFDAPPTLGVNPRLFFEFDTKETAEAVKGVVAKAARDGEPAGCTLARLLGVRPKKKAKQ